MSNQEILKRFLLLFLSLMLFAGLTIPIYFLMTAGAKKDGPEVSTQPVVVDEIALEDAVPGMMGSSPVQDETQVLQNTTFMLNKGAFFGGFALILVLYTVYYFAFFEASSIRSLRRVIQSC